MFSVTKCLHFPELGYSQDVAGMLEVTGLLSRNLF